MPGKLSRTLSQTKAVLLLWAALEVTQRLASMGGARSNSASRFYGRSK
ncbi:hypothetical protein LEP1GSC105_0738 [Leptospira interrogans str. UI 12758]|uniref:Uncharacterized protein n=2 Tax=Leptospira interrogans TaxID=173 RepID=A0A0E2CZU5_LEPIR|nr:hypothetical protein LEP1GSC105_0738 [Leptospira interrogans str. UI 12758]